MTSDTAKWTRCFNDKFLEFMNELIQSFPDDKDFKLFKQSFNMLKLVDETKPLLIFRIHASIYKTQIESKDETFFLEHNFENEMKIAQQNSNDANFSNDLMMKLKQYWVDLTQENKEIVWKYLILLYKINDKICI